MEGSPSNLSTINPSLRSSYADVAFRRSPCPNQQEDENNSGSPSPPREFTALPPPPQQKLKPRPTEKPHPHPPQRTKEEEAQTCSTPPPSPPTPPHRRSHRPSQKKVGLKEKLEEGRPSSASPGRTHKGAPFFKMGGSIERQSEVGVRPHSALPQETSATLLDLAPTMGEKSPSYAQVFFAATSDQDSDHGDIEDLPIDVVDAAAAVNKWDYIPPPITSESVVSEEDVLYTHPTIPGLIIKRDVGTTSPKPPSRSRKHKNKGQRVARDQLELEEEFQLPERIAATATPPPPTLMETTAEVDGLPQPPRRSKKKKQEGKCETFSSKEKSKGSIESPKVVTLPVPPIEEPIPTPLVPSTPVLAVVGDESHLELKEEEDDRSISEASTKKKRKKVKKAKVEDELEKALKEIALQEQQKLAKKAKEPEIVLPIVEERPVQQMPGKEEDKTPSTQTSKRKKKGKKEVSGVENVKSEAAHISTPAPLSEKVSSTPIQLGNVDQSVVGVPESLADVGTEERPRTISLQGGDDWMALLDDESIPMDWGDEEESLPTIEKQTKEESHDAVEKPPSEEIGEETPRPLRSDDEELKASELVATATAPPFIETTPPPKKERKKHKKSGKIVEPVVDATTALSTPVVVGDKPNISLHGGDDWMSLLDDVSSTPMDWGDEEEHVKQEEESLIDDVPLPLSPSTKQSLESELTFPTKEDESKGREDRALRIQETKAASAAVPSKKGKRKSNKTASSIPTTPAEDQTSHSSALVSEPPPKNDLTVESSGEMPRNTTEVPHQSAVEVDQAIKVQEEKVEYLPPPPPPPPQVSYSTVETIGKEQSVLREELQEAESLLPPLPVKKGKRKPKKSESEQNSPVVEERVLSEASPPPHSSSGIQDEENRTENANTFKVEASAIDVENIDSSESCKNEVETVFAPPTIAPPASAKRAKRKSKKSELKPEVDKSSLLIVESITTTTADNAPITKSENVPVQGGENVVQVEEKKSRGSPTTPPPSDSSAIHLQGGDDWMNLLDDTTPMNWDEDEDDKTAPTVSKQEKRESTIVEHIPQLSQYLLDTYAALDKPQVKEVSPLFSAERMKASSSKKKDLPEEYERFTEPQKSFEETKKLTEAVEGKSHNHHKDSKKPHVVTKHEKRKPKTSESKNAVELSQEGGKGDTESKGSVQDHVNSKGLEGTNAPTPTKDHVSPSLIPQVSTKAKAKGKSDRGLGTLFPPIASDNPHPIAPQSQEEQIECGDSDVDLSSVVPSDEFVASQQLVNLQMKQQEQLLKSMEPPSEGDVPKSPKSKALGRQGEGSLKKGSSEESSEEKRVRFVESPEVVTICCSEPTPPTIVGQLSVASADGDVDSDVEENNSKKSPLPPAKHKKKKKRSPRSTPTLRDGPSPPPRSPSPLPPYSRPEEGELPQFPFPKKSKKKQPGNKERLHKRVEHEEGEGEEMMVMPQLEPISSPSLGVEVEGEPGESEIKSDSTESWTNILDEEEPKLTLAVENLEFLLGDEIDAPKKPRPGDLTTTATLPHYDDDAHYDDRSSLSPISPSNNQHPINLNRAGGEEEVEEHHHHYQEEGKIGDRGTKDKKVIIAEAEEKTTVCGREKELLPNLTTTTLHISSPLSAEAEDHSSRLLQLNDAERSYQEYLGRQRKAKGEDESLEKVHVEGDGLVGKEKGEDGALTLAAAAKAVTRQVQQLTDTINDSYPPNKSQPLHPHPLQQDSSLLHLLLIYNEFERQYREGIEQRKKLAEQSKKEQSLDGKGRGGDGPRDQPPPPPRSPKGGRKGGSGGGPYQIPKTEIWCGGIPSSNWVDYSTSLSGTTHSDQLNILDKVKDSAKEDVANLGTAVNSAISRLHSLSSENLEDLVERSWELLGGLKDLEGASSSLREIISSLPQDDPEVVGLFQDLQSICEKLGVTMGESERLNKAAKDQRQLGLDAGRGMTSEESEILLLPTPRVEEPELMVDIPMHDDEQVESEVKVSGSLITSITSLEEDGTAPIVEEVEDAEEVRSTPVGGSDGATFLKSVEESTVLIPPEGTMSFITTGPDGQNYLTNMQRTVVLNKRKETTQSLHFSSLEGPERSSSSGTIGPVLPGTERSFSPELVDEMPPFSLPSGTPTDSLELLQSPTRSISRPNTPLEEGEELTVRVRQVTKHVTRRVIRKRRRIIRKVVIVNGKEEFTEEIVDEPDEVDEQTAEITSGPVVDYSTSLHPTMGPSSPGVSIVEIESYTPRSPTPTIIEAPDIPEEVEEVLRATLETSVGPILSKTKLEELIKQRLKNVSNEGEGEVTQVQIGEMEQKTEISQPQQQQCVEVEQKSKSSETIEPMNMSEQQQILSQDEAENANQNSFGLEKESDAGVGDKKTDAVPSQLNDIEEAPINDAPLNMANEKICLTEQEERLPDARSSIPHELDATILEKEVETTRDVAIIVGESGDTSLSIAHEHQNADKSEQNLPHQPAPKSKDIPCREGPNSAQTLPHPHPTLHSQTEVESTLEKTLQEVQELSKEKHVIMSLPTEISELASAEQTSDDAVKITITQTQPEANENKDHLEPTLPLDDDQRESNVEISSSIDNFAVEEIKTLAMPLHPHEDLQNHEANISRQPSRSIQTPAVETAELSTETELDIQKTEIENLNLDQTIPENASQIFQQSEHSSGIVATDPPILAEITTAFSAADKADQEPAATSSSDFESRTQNSINSAPDVLNKDKHTIEIETNISSQQPAKSEDKQHKRKQRNRKGKVTPQFSKDLSSEIPDEPEGGSSIPAKDLSVSQQPPDDQNEKYNQTSTTSKAEDERAPASMVFAEEEEIFSAQIELEGAKGELIPKDGVDSKTTEPEIGSHAIRNLLDENLRPAVDNLAADNIRKHSKALTVLDDASTLCPHPPSDEPNETESSDNAQKTEAYIPPNNMLTETEHYLDHPINLAEVDSIAETKSPIATVDIDGSKEKAIGVPSKTETVSILEEKQGKAAESLKIQELAKIEQKQPKGKDRKKGKLTAQSSKDIDPITAQDFKHKAEPEAVAVQTVTEVLAPSIDENEKKTSASEEFLKDTKKEQQSVPLLPEDTPSQTILEMEQIFKSKDQTEEMVGSPIIGETNFHSSKEKNSPEISITSPLQTGVRDVLLSEESSPPKESVATADSSITSPNSSPLAETELASKMKPENFHFPMESTHAPLEPSHSDKSFHEQKDHDHPSQGKENSLEQVSEIEEVNISTHDEENGNANVNQGCRPEIEETTPAIASDANLESLSKVDEPVPLSEGNEEPKTHRIRRSKKEKSHKPVLADKPVAVPVLEQPLDTEKLRRSLKLTRVIKTLETQAQQGTIEEASHHPTPSILAASAPDIPQLTQRVRDGLRRLESSLASENEEQIPTELLLITETITEIVETFKIKLYQIHCSPSPLSQKMQETSSLEEQIREALPSIHSFKNIVKEHPAIPPELEASLVPPLEQILASNSTVLSVAPLYSKLDQEAASFEAENMVKGEISKIDLQTTKLLSSDKPSAVLVEELDSLEQQLNQVRKERELSPKNEELERALFAVQSLISEERERLLQLNSISQEYEQSLKELSQVIKVAEDLVSPEKISVANLPQLQEQLKKNRKFFGNLKRCRNALEKLEFGLDPETKESNQLLHSSLYEKASSILRRAGKKRQQLAVASARWARLEEGLAEERNWLAAVAKRIPSLEKAESCECEQYCATYQSLYSDLIVHQARLFQLRSVSDSLKNDVDSPVLDGISDPLVEQLLKISGEITGGLQALVAFRDSFSNYELLMQRLKAWLQKAEGKMDAIALQPVSHPYDFWELKAQLECQQPLKNEACELLEQALQTLPLADEGKIRQIFSNFDDRWSALLLSVQQTESSTFQEEPGECSSDVSVAARLDTMGRELGDMQGIISSMVITVESEDDLYQYLEKLQILKAQLLNKRHQLSNLVGEGAEDAERAGQLLTIISQLDDQVTTELDVAHTAREKFATFGRMSAKTKQLQDTLRARVDQWTSFFELSQDILRQALQSCQALDEDIARNHGDLDKMRGVLDSFPSTPHFTLNTRRMEHELHEMEATVHTLSARIQDLRKRVQEQLGFWQQYEQALSSLAQLVTQAQSTLDAVEEEVPTRLNALRINHRHIKNAEQLLASYNCRELEEIVESLSNDSPLEVRKQIEERVKLLVSEWKGTACRLAELDRSLTTADNLWTIIEEEKSDLESWHKECARHSLSEREQVTITEFPAKEAKMNELRSLTSELCITLGNKEHGKSLSSQLPLTFELEGLSRKLESLKSYFTSVNSLIQDTPGKYQLLDEAKLSLKAAPAIQPPDLDSMKRQLLQHATAEGKIKSLEDDPQELTDILKASQQVFHQTFEEYVKIWKALPQRAETEEVVHLWNNSLMQCRRYLSEPLPSSREQLMEEASLCSVHQNILSGQNEGLDALLASESPEDFKKVESLYREIEGELKERQDAIGERLCAWSEYKQSQRNLASWLHLKEREKREMELPFLHLRRIPQTKTQIERMIEQLPRGEKLLNALKSNHSALLPFITPELSTQVSQELASYSARYGNLEAALHTWADNVERLSGMRVECDKRFGHISSLMNFIREKLEEEVESEPSSVAEVKQCVKNIESLFNEAELLSLPLEELVSYVEGMKSSITPSDSRLLQQQQYSLSQQYVELLSDLSERKEEIEQKLDVIPNLTTKCKNLLLWTKEMKEKVEQPSCQRLEDYQIFLDGACSEEINAKSAAFEWIKKNGEARAKNTTSKEKKEISSLLKELDMKWNELLRLVDENKKRVDHLIQLQPEIESQLKGINEKLRKLEQYVKQPVALKNPSLEEIALSLEQHEEKQLVLNNDTVAINAALQLCEVWSTDCQALRMHNDAHNLLKKMDSLDTRWKELISGLSSKKAQLINLRERIYDLDEKCEMLQLLLSQVEKELSDISASELDSSLTAKLHEKRAKILELIQSLQAMSPKIEDLNNDYCFLAKKINASNPGPLSGKVKRVIKDWRSHLNNCHHALDLLQKSLLRSQFEESQEQVESFYQDLCKKAEELQSRVNKASRTPGTLEQRLLEIADSLTRGQELVSSVNQRGKKLIEIDPPAKKIVNEKRSNIKALQSHLDALLKSLNKQLEAEEVDSSVQVNTLTGEHDASVQVKTLPLTPLCTAPEIRAPTTSKLTREDIYIQELSSTISACDQQIAQLEESLNKATAHDALVKMLSLAQSQLGHLNHLHKLLVKEQGISEEDAGATQIKNIGRKLEEMEQKVRSSAQETSSSTNKEVMSCPVCTPAKRGAWDSTLWRLEQWLTHAEGKLKAVMKKRPPTDVEQLEDAILRHRDIVLDLDSHRALVNSLSEVLSHLNEHEETSTMGQVEVDQLSTRLRAALGLWKKVCHNTALWQARLQIALMENSGFSENLVHYENFLKEIQDSIQQLEPVDLSQPSRIISAKLKKFSNMRNKLLRGEPEVATLYATAQQLFVNPTAIEKEGSCTLGPSDKDVFVDDKCIQILDRISSLNLQLGALQKVCNAYVKHLSAAATAEEIPEESSVLNLSEEILERSSRSSPAFARSSHSTATSDNEEEESLLRRGGRYVGRVMRASIPIQALILLLLGAATLIPHEEDYLCILKNNFQRSLEPMLHYPDGPPPI